MPWRWLTFGIAVITLALIFGRKAPDGSLRVPSNPQEVLEHVPSASPGVKQLRALEAALREEPEDRGRAVAVAQAAILLARREADPRYWGRAQAALAPWWRQDDPPPDVRLVRAIIRQAQHDFVGARSDLRRLTTDNPDNMQGWLTLAVVSQVIGDYDDARNACARLDGRVHDIVSTVCHAQVDSLTGKAATAHRTLEYALTHAPADAPLAWALSVLGEIDLRAGDDVSAEKAFRAALARDGEDSYTRCALADLLLDLDRPLEVEPLLSSQLSDDNGVLRLAIAEHRTLGKSGPYAQMLEARYQASEARGDTVHLREQARFALEVKGDAGRALELAKKNFEVQKEPADLRILMMAALAAGKPDEAAAAVELLRTSGAEEPRLVALAKKVHP
jgi:predicted Zn-dependent protease